MNYNPTVISSMALMNTFGMIETDCVIEETKSDISEGPKEVPFDK